MIHSNYLRVKKMGLFEWILTPKKKRDEENDTLGVSVNSWRENRWEIREESETLLKMEITES